MAASRDPSWQFSPHTVYTNRNYTFAERKELHEPLSAPPSSARVWPVKEIRKRIAEQKLAALEGAEDCCFSSGLGRGQPGDVYAVLCHNFHVVASTADSTAARAILDKTLHRSVCSVVVPPATIKRSRRIPSEDPFCSSAKSRPILQKRIVDMERLAEIGPPVSGRRDRRDLREPRFNQAPAGGRHRHRRTRRPPSIWEATMSSRRCGARCAETVDGIRSWQACDGGRSSIPLADYCSVRGSENLRPAHRAAKRQRAKKNGGVIPSIRKSRRWHYAAFRAIAA